MRRLIINTGMRTDIPAFYSEWLMNRVREGFVYVRNPYYRLQVFYFNKFTILSTTISVILL